MNHHTVESLIEAESRVVQLFNEGQLPYLLHLSGGNEAKLIEIFQMIKPEDWVLSTHRAHYHFLLKGGTPDELVKNIKAGRSMFLYSAALNFLSSSIVAGLVSTAVGLGMASTLQGYRTEEARCPRVWCFLGDGGEDEGHFYEAVRYANGHNLPVTFIIENNNRSVETSIRKRWGDHDIPIDWPNNVIRYNYTPTYPHAGTGGKMVQFTPQSIEEAREAWSSYYARPHDWTKLIEEAIEEGH